ncbi:hypothetical protein FIBSPDRAFT_965309 [Athelia psychrophila]|uniref:Starter acyltransferase (SAT) domain-containing protein n=1 Tax=Athelia psychrophila TaxID=1759441 RepID=A0A165WSG4_9AGAM|nr:hypothetical protein FIBSPDRAFT_965309 [Fibularhizoctonia sp. CBS 109695]
MSSRHPDVPVFSGQGTDFVNAARTHAQGRYYPRFLWNSISNLRSIWTNNPYDIHTGIDLLAPSPQAVNNPILSSARLFLLQVLWYLAHVETLSSLQIRFHNALVLLDTSTKSLGVLGSSSGVLAACVTAASMSLPAYISYSVQAFRLAFWVGFRLQEYRHNVLVNMDSTAIQLPWSVAVFGLDQHALENHIADFGTRVQRLSSNYHRRYCPELLTVCALRSTTLSTLYHSATHLASARQQTLEDASLRNICFPELSDLTTPIRSTYAGELISNTTPGSLVKLVVDMLLMHPVNWDLAVASLKRDAGNSAFCPANYSPGLGLMRITEKALEGTASIAVDITLEFESKSNERNAKHEPNHDRR